MRKYNKPHNLFLILFVLATVAMLGCTGGEQAVETDTTTEALETIASEAQPSTAAAEKEEETHISIEMLEVSGGTFQRDGDANNTTKVSPFMMGKYSVTREQFSSIMGYDPAHSTMSINRMTQGVTDPIHRISWYEAITYCNKLSIAEGLTPAYSIDGIDFSEVEHSDIPQSQNELWDKVKCDWSADGYRLPTVSEWLWAAMGGSKDAQSGAIDSNNINRTGYKKKFAGYDGTNSIDDYAWYGRLSGEGTATQTSALPVGTKLPNELGFYDMSGNISELCWDWWNNEYDYPTGNLTDFRGATHGVSIGGRISRTHLGGHWNSDEDRLAISTLHRIAPFQRENFSGLRVVRSK